MDPANKPAGKLDEINCCPANKMAGKSERRLKTTRYKA